MLMGTGYLVVAFRDRRLRRGAYAPPVVHIDEGS
jgi:hypothetical protein